MVPVCATVSASDGCFCARQSLWSHILHLHSVTSLNSGVARQIGICSDLLTAPWECRHLPSVASCHTMLYARAFVGLALAVVVAAARPSISPNTFSGFIQVHTRSWHTRACIEAAAPLQLD